MILINIQIGKQILRKTEHQRSTFLVSNKSSELPPGLFNSLLVLIANSWIALPHGIET